MNAPRTFAVVCALLIHVEGHAQSSALPPDSLDRARTLTKWILSGTADSLWTAKAERLSAGMFASPDSLRRTLEGLNQRLGDRQATIEERFVWSRGDRQYWQAARVAQQQEPVVVRLMLNEDGRLDGLAISLASQLPPIDSGGIALGSASNTPRLLANPTTSTVRPASDFGVTMKVDTMGPGTITVQGAANYRGSFTADGRQFYFFRKTGAGESYRIFVSDRTATTWSMPVEVDLGGDYSDLYPTISADGERMVFASYRPLPDTSLERANAHLWMSRRTNGRWGTPEPLSTLNEPGSYHPGPRFEPSGSLAWHVQSRAGRVAWRSEWLAGRFSARSADTSEVLWQRKLPSGHRVWDVLIHEAGDLAVLGVTVRPNWPTDLWISIRRDEDWSVPVPLPKEINQGGFENFHLFSPDGRTLHFVRDFGAVLQVDVSQIREYAARVGHS